MVDSRAASSISALMSVEIRSTRRRHSVESDIRTQRAPLSFFTGRLTRASGGGGSCPSGDVTHRRSTAKYRAFHLDSNSTDAHYTYIVPHRWNSHLLLLPTSLSPRSFPSAFERRSSGGTACRLFGCRHPKGCQHFPDLIRHPSEKVLWDSCGTVRHSL